MKWKPPLLLGLSIAIPPTMSSRAATAADRAAVVNQTPGLVAFWDFVKREPDGERRFLAHVPRALLHDSPLDIKGPGRSVKQDYLISSAYNAYMQGHFARLPGVQEGEDETFPKEQYYNPPEGEPLTVEGAAVGNRTSAAAGVNGSRQQHDTQGRGSRS